MYFEGICDRPASQPTDRPSRCVTWVSRSVTLSWMGVWGVQGRLRVLFSGISQHAELDFEGIRIRGHR